MFGVLFAQTGPDVFTQQGTMIWVHVRDVEMFPPEQEPILISWYFHEG